jgi:hypothetical protein
VFAHGQAQRYSFTILFDIHSLKKTVEGMASSLIYCIKLCVTVFKLMLSTKINHKSDTFVIQTKLNGKSEVSTDILLANIIKGIEEVKGNDIEI